MYPQYRAAVQIEPKTPAVRSNMMEKVSSRERNNLEVPACSGRENDCDLLTHVTLSITYKNQTKWHLQKRGVGALLIRGGELF
jgi:hypothetical protein